MSPSPFRKTLHLVLVLCFLAGLMVTPALAGPSQDAGKKIDEIQGAINAKERELNRLKSENDRALKALKNVTHKEKMTLAELNRLDQQIETTSTHLTEVTNDLEAAVVRLAATVKELERTQRKLAIRTDLLNRRVRAIYEHGSVTYLDVLLTAQSFSDFLTRYENLERVVEGDVQLFKDVTAWRDEVTQAKARQEEETARVEAARAQVAEKKAELEGQYQRKDEYRQQLKQDKASIRRALDELERDSQRVTADLQRLSKQLEEQLSVDGVLVLAHPAPGVPVTSNYGMRMHPILGERRMHTGTDYGLQYGRSIKASAAGVVVSAGWLGGYGKAVILFHGKGISTLYAHMSELHVSSGQKVQKGQVIGLVGSTGNSTGPHLHFEVRQNGVPQNPADFIGKPIR